jgi:hypothetical protein
MIYQRIPEEKMWLSQENQDKLAQVITGIKKMVNKPVGDRDHEVLGMGSFGEYKLYGKST